VVLTCRPFCCSRVTEVLGTRFCGDELISLWTFCAVPLSWDVGGNAQWCSLASSGPLVHVFRLFSAPCTWERWYAGASLLCFFSLPRRLPLFSLCFVSDQLAASGVSVHVPRSMTAACLCFDQSKSPGARISARRHRGEYPAHSGFGTHRGLWEIASCLESAWLPSGGWCRHTSRMRLLWCFCPRRMVACGFVCFWLRS